MLDSNLVRGSFARRSCLVVVISGVLTTTMGTTALGGPISNRIGQWAYRRQAQASMLKAYSAQAQVKPPSHAAILASWKHRVFGSSPSASQTSSKRPASLDFNARTFDR